MPDRRFFLTGLAAALTLPSLVFGEPLILSPGEALEEMDKKRLILLDIRRPEEWQQTGVARGAWPLDMSEQDFGPRLIAVLERNPNRDVAVICRTGNRSGHLVDLLKQNGIPDVIDISEGMVGGRNGPGWIKAGLPVVAASEALEALPADLTAD